MKKLLIISLLVLFSITGCKYVCEEKTVCEEYGLINPDGNCLSEIIYHVPNGFNETMNIPLTLNSSELCYDFASDPLEIKKMVDKVFEEHPDDWEHYINWTPVEGEPKIFIIEDNVSEIVEEKVYNGTKLGRICIKERKMNVCRWR